MMEALQATINLKMSSVPPWKSSLPLPKPHTGPAAAQCHPGHYCPCPAVSFPSATLKNSTTFYLKGHPHLPRHTEGTVFHAHALY